MQCCYRVFLGHVISFGAYGTVMFSISELVKLNISALPILLIVGLGILTGFMVSSRIIQYFYIITVL